MGYCIFLIHYYHRSIMKLSHSKGDMYSLLSTQLGYFCFLIPLCRVIKSDPRSMEDSVNPWLTIINFWSQDFPISVSENLKSFHWSRILFSIEYLNWLFQVADSLMWLNSSKLDYFRFLIILCRVWSQIIGLWETLLIQGWLLFFIEHKTCLV